jgi:gamma-glutamyltranspeptidase/glutathione hydrolase
VKSQAPIHITTHGYDIYLPPPPTSGGLLVAFGMKLLESVPAAIWDNPTATCQYLLAAMSITQSARVSALDPALHDPSKSLDALVADFLAPTHIDGWRAQLGSVVKEGPKAPLSEVPTLGSTTHISVVDDKGLACSITSSNGEGCGHVVPGLGAMANNFMGEADLHPHGFHISPPGTALTSMMCPMVVAKDGRPVLSIGTGGSNRIRTALLQVLARHLYAGTGIHHAVCAPRIHFEGDTLYLESHGTEHPMPPETLEVLRGQCQEHTIFETPNMFFGGVHAAATNRVGAGDGRRGGSVATT